jgi:hypothetical protein
MQEEIWKDVVGYEYYFKVSESGKIFNKRSGRELSTIVGKTGYRCFTTRLNGRQSKALVLKVHILVCEAFHGPRPNDIQIYALHWDDDKLNNHYNNLRWGSRSENAKDSVRNGKYSNNYQTGEDVKNSKLTEQAVLDILENFENILVGNKSRKIEHFMRKYNVSRSTVRGVLEGRRWRHISNAVLNPK